MNFSVAPRVAHPSSAAITVLVVDDQPAVRQGLARLFACAPLALRAVATAATAAEALRLAAQWRPEVVVLDVDLAGEDGLALIPQFGPAVAVLVLSCHGDPTTRARAARLGALAFIEKHQPAADLLGAVVALADLQMRGERTPGGQGTNTRSMPVDSSAALGPQSH